MKGLFGVYCVLVGIHVHDLILFVGGVVLIFS